MPYLAKDFKLLVQQKKMSNFLTQLLSEVGDDEYLNDFDDVLKVIQSKRPATIGISGSEYHNLFKELRGELEQRERRNNTQIQENKMTIKDTFTKWLKEDVSRKGDLPSWHKFVELINFKNSFYYLPNQDFNNSDKIFWEWEESDGDFLKYLEIFAKFSSDETILPIIRNFVAYCKNKWIFITEIKNKLTYAEGKIKPLESELTDIKQQLDQNNSKIVIFEEIQKILTDFKSSGEGEEVLKNLKEEPKKALEAVKFLIGKINEIKEEQKLSAPLQTELENLKTKSADQEKQLIALATASGLISQELETLKQRNQELESKEDQVKNQITNYEKEVQNLLKVRAKLEIDNEKLVQNNQELQTQLNQQKDKLSRLEGDASLLTNQLSNLAGELEIVPTENAPEKKTLSAKISFFENWWKKIKQEKEEIVENLEKEQQETQTLRQSLTELEEQLKNTGDDNTQQLRKLGEETKKEKKKIKDLEIDLNSEKKKVEQLTQQIEEKNAQLKNLGLTLTIKQKQIVEQKKQNKILTYTLMGAIVIIILGIGYYFWRKFRN